MLLPVLHVSLPSLEWNSTVSYSVPHMRDPHIADGSTLMKCLLQLIFCTSSPSKGCFWEHLIRFKDSVHQHLGRHGSYQHWLLEQSKCTATCPRRHVQWLQSRKWEFIWISQRCIPEPLKFSNTDFLVQTRSREHCGDQESSSSRSMFSSQCIWQCFKCCFNVSMFQAPLLKWRQCTKVWQWERAFLLLAT